MAPIELTIELVVNQPPTSGRFLIPDSGQAACSQLINSIKIALYNGQTGNLTHLSQRNLILEQRINEIVNCMYSDVALHCINTYYKLRLDQSVVPCDR